VSWTGSGGSLSQPSDTTDVQGRSTVVWTLPTTPGSYSARASADGVGDVLFTATAQPVGGAIVFRYLDAGGYHACGITTGEQLLCWGYGADGQLGLGTTAPVPYPTLIPGDYRYRMVTGGYYHSCGFTLAGNAWCWGNNSDGRLGDGGVAGQSETPVQVTTAETIDTVQADTLVGGHIALTVQALQAGRLHTCGIDLSQHAWCWGGNGEGELGRGISGPGNFFPSASLVATVELFKAITVGGLHTCGITVAGDAHCWGYNVAGQLGDGSTATSNLPVLVVGGLKFRTDPAVIFRSPDPDFPLPPGPFIAAGYDHTCGITAGGTTVCWGLNQNGQLGDGSNSGRTTPTAVAGGQTFVTITAGLRHTCALNATGGAFCWGDNTYGELGDGTTTDRFSPTAVSGGLQFAYLKAGELSTCGVTSEGVAYCWGDNEYGQLGDGTTTSSSVPVKVAFQL
jgi:alpha-tubulin suppressor-like RCC1 family protein